MLVQQQRRPGGNQVWPQARGFSPSWEPDVLLGTHAQGPRDILDDCVSSYQPGEATN